MLTSCGQEGQQCSRGLRDSLLGRSAEMNWGEPIVSGNHNVWPLSKHLSARFFSS